ncbi:hypothetical protein JOD63_002207 [Microbacterium terrae]|uniref:Uncharacterized protein n=1 Tax=Microbacterium terrae TaxID=69369 RepID=A0A0M2HAA0_9MICO|nr:IniB N-terminal domain-containing protein [Microbacterium terrae]KJL40950.1 hypothetical protein RS81_01494 [Microbacterium terrae]MBP1078239.1 hypothetical protein [Microbacterium terrae]GLJ97718.1 hypothetical protein GCM10017594_09150 [Microbacterium terrae]
MSVTLATVAEALIEFILSLLRDPDAAEEFAKDPDGALAQRGLGNVTASDVQAVTPVVIDRVQVIPAPSGSGGGGGGGDDHSTPVSIVVSQAAAPAVREIQNITQNFTWADNRASIVDQSTNQSIWAGGDVTQVFDQEAAVASGDDAIAAGEDVDIDQTSDHSVTVTAGGAVNIGSDTTVTVVEDSYNDTTDNSVTTDNSTTATIVASGNDGLQVTTSESSGNTTSTTTETTSSTQVVLTDDSVGVSVGASQTPAAPAAPAAPAPEPALAAAEPAPAPAPEPEPEPMPEPEPESDEMFGADDSGAPDEMASDDEF